MLGSHEAPGRKHAWCLVSIQMSITDRPAVATNTTTSCAGGLGDHTTLTDVLLPSLRH
jgi:hypothetical protein